MNQKEFRFVGSKSLRDPDPEETREQKVNKQPRIGRFFATSQKSPTERLLEPTTGDILEGLEVYKNAVSSSDVLKIEDLVKSRLEPIGNYGDKRRCILTARDSNLNFLHLPIGFDKVVVEEFTGPMAGYMQRTESSQFNLPPCCVLWLGSDFVMIFRRGKDQMAYWKTHQGMCFVYQRQGFDGKIERELPMKTKCTTVHLGTVKRGQSFRVLQLSCYSIRK